jgi:DHA2 family multidrug resistance protein
MRFNLRLHASVAFVIMGVTCFLRSDFYIGIDFYHVAMMQLMMGLGVALFFMPVTVMLLSDLEQNEIAAGSGLATFLRTLAGSFAASITTLLWDRRASVHHAQLAESINAYNPIAQHAITQLGDGDPQTGASLINNMITQQSYQMGFNELFHALGWIFILLIPVIWLTRPPFTAKSSAAAAGGH